MQKFEYEVLIIGSGASALYSALKISRRNDFKGRILIVTKCPFGESNSRYAQGGIASAIKNNISDNISLYVNDTLKSGDGLSDESVVHSIIADSEAVINDLEYFGTKFDYGTNGEYEFALGGGHSTKRVLHCGEDATGMVMIKALSDAVKSSQNIDILPKVMAVELIVDNNQCFGAVIFDKAGKEHKIVLANSVILASGGAGQVYKYTTNPYGATGDGIALAFQAGVVIRDLEFVQFHPTALALNSNRYLISEAVRGEGAKLVNHQGEEFMQNYSDKKELAQRDVVARAIISEMEKENSSNVFLKTSDIDKDVLLKRFPTIAKKCKSSGIDITKDFIPIAPAAHYMIGGIEAEINGKTSIDGLYAVGEVASVGFHGANRLASNSLLECVVCANKLSQELKFTNKIPNNQKIANIVDFYSAENLNENYNLSELKNELKDLMWRNVGIIRSEASLKEAKIKIETLMKDYNFGKCYSSAEEYEYRNMLLTSLLIAKCALERKESRGAHYRSDYPNKCSIAEHTYIKRR